MWRYWTILLSFFCALALVGGCGKKGPKIAVFPVSGTVTYNDKPLSGATVSYVPSSPDAPRSSGITDDDGRFSLKTYLSGVEVYNGAPAGDYKVVVIKLQPKQGAGSGALNEASKMENMSPEERAAMMTKSMQQTLTQERGARDTKPKSEVPVKYGAVETSDLTATVKAGENPPVEFKLHD